MGVDVDDLDATRNYQYYATPIGLPNNGFALVWQNLYTESNYNVSVQNARNFGVRLQIYNHLNEPLGTRIVINNFTFSDTSYPSLSLLKNGDIIVVFSGREHANAAVSSIYARIINLNNQSNSNKEFPISLDSTNDDSIYGKSYSAVSVLSDGKIAVAYQADDGDKRGVFLTLLYANGSFALNEFQVSNNIYGEQLWPKLSPLHDGFAITFQHQNDTAPDNLGDLYCVLYNNDGVKQKPEFRVSTHINGSQAGASITSLGDKYFAVAYSSFAQNGDSEGIWVRIFYANGIPKGPEFKINANTPSDISYNQMLPSLAPFEDGSLIATWQAIKYPQNNSVIYARKIDINGTLLTPQFEVSTKNISNDQNFSGVITYPKGSYLVSYQEISNGSFLRHKAFDSSDNEWNNQVGTNNFTDSNFKFTYGSNHSLPPIKINPAIPTAQDNDSEYNSFYVTTGIAAIYGSFLGTVLLGYGLYQVYKCIKKAMAYSSGNLYDLPENIITGDQSQALTMYKNNFTNEDTVSVAGADLELGFAGNELDAPASAIID